LHGKLVSLGFASISSTDAGFYGRGIYLTSYAPYVLPYLEDKKSPSIIICYTTPGNIYPVTEHPHNDKKSLLGTAQKPGYNSHYVLTDTTGFPLTTKSQSSNPKFFDELVISQESQVVAAFILEIDSSNFTSIASLFKESNTTVRNIHEIEQYNNEYDTPQRTIAITSESNENENVYYSLENL